MDDPSSDRAHRSADDRELASAGVRDLARRPPEERERGVELLASRLDRPVALLGVVFLLVVLGQNTATSPGLQRTFAVVGWVLWLLFVAEFLLRLFLAPHRSRFLRRNWWQVVFLVLPALRFLRVLAVLRVARAGGVLSSAIRSTRSAGRILSSRIGWVAALTVIVILASSQLLFTFDVYDSYGDALHAAALATITGEPFARPQGLAKVVEVLLAAYSVAVFATLAGSLGAFFLEERRTTTGAGTG